MEVISSFEGEEKSSLSECDRQINEPILAAETPVSYGWLEKQARTYRRKMEAQAKKEAREAQREREREGRAEREEARREYQNATAAVTLQSSSRSSIRMQAHRGLAY